MINYVLDEFVNNDKSITEATYSSQIQNYEEKDFELTSLSIKINNTKIALFGLDDIYYQLTLGKFNAFIANSNLGSYCIHIRNELVSIDEKSSNSSNSFPILQNNPFQNLEHMIEVSIYSLGKDPNESISVSNLNLDIVLSNILFNIDIPHLIKLSSLSEVFNDLPVIHSINDEPMTICFSLKFSNLLLGYERLGLSPQLILKFDNINIFTKDLLSFDLCVSISKANALLIDHSIPVEANTNDISLLNYLINLGYANMLTCDNLIASVNINNSETPNLKINLNLAKEKSNLYFDMCQDSLVTLNQLVEKMLLLIPERKMKTSDNKLPVTKEIKMVIDEDVYSIKDNDKFNEKKSYSLVSDDEDKYIISNIGYSQNTSNCDYTKNNTVYKTKNKVKSYSNDLINDNNFLENMYNKIKSKKTMLKLPNPLVNINVNNINFHIRIFDGYDWKETCQEVQISDIILIEYLRRSKTSIIDIELNDICFDYSLYPDTSYYASKLHFSINEFEIKDKVYDSNYNEFLSAQDSVELPMFKFEISNIRPILSDPTIESIVNLYISPLRLYIDQDTLRKFADIVNCFNLDTRNENETITPSTSSSNRPTSIKPTMKNTDYRIKKKNSNYTFFRKVNISDIRIIVDYKPKQFDINKLKNGQIQEVLNVIPLKDATLNFESLEFNGVTGVNKLVQRIIEKHLPKVFDQVPSIVLYIKPIRPFFKISQKMIDLIKNIYNKNYKNEQSMISGKIFFFIIFFFFFFFFFFFYFNL